MCAASCAGDRSSATSMSPPARIGRGLRWRPPASAPMRVVMVRLTSARPCGCRYAVRRTTVGGSAPAGSRRPRSAQPLARMRGSAPRNVWTAASGSPTRTRSARPPRTPAAAGRRRWCSWASSTTTSRTCAPTLAKASASSSSLVGGGGEDPGRVVGAGPGERGDLVVLAEHLRGGDPLGPAMFNTDGREPVGLDPVLDGPHEQVARPRRGSLVTEGHEDVLRPGRLRSLTAGVTVEQLAEDDVLFWTADQPRRVITAEGRLAAQDAEPERLMSTGQRFRRRAGQSRGHALAKPGGRHPCRGEQEALVGVRPP